MPNIEATTRPSPDRKSDQDADHQHAAHETEVAACGQHIAGQHQEDAAGHPEGRGHQLRAILRGGQVVVDDRAQRKSHEAGQGEHAQQAPAAVAESGGQEQQPEIADQSQNQAWMRQIQRHGKSSRQRAEQQRKGK